METPSLKPLKQQHRFCRKSFNEHSYHVRFQFAKQFQRRRLKSKSLDNGCQVTAIRHMTFIFLIRVVTHLVDSLFGGVVPLSREARSYFYTPGFPRGNGGCSLNLYTQLYVCKYQQRKRSLWYATHRPMVMHIHTKYH